MWENLKKEGIIIFSRVRNYVAEIKEDFYSAKEERLVKVWNKINLLCVLAISFLGYFMSFIFLLLKFNLICSIIFALISIYFLLAIVNPKVYRLTAKTSFKIVQRLLIYGKVVTKKDWENIKKHSNKDAYKAIRTSKSKGYCYFYSRIIASYIKDAKLMYCSVKSGDHFTAHAVVLKDNCVYDTNYRTHCDYDEYIEKENATIYKIFSVDQYRKKSFFDDIREDFKKWCAERNVYCDPQ